MCVVSDDVFVQNFFANSNFVYKLLDFFPAFAELSFGDCLQSVFLPRGTASRLKHLAETPPAQS